MDLFGSIKKEIYGIVKDAKKKSIQKNTAIKKLNSVLTIKKCDLFKGNKRALNNEIVKAKRIVRGGLF